MAVEFVGPKGRLVMKHASERLAAWLTPALLLLLLAPSAAMPRIGNASPIDILTLTQTMIEDQGEVNLLLGLDFGVDPNSPIKFTSAVDPIAMSYTFATLPGTTYLGQLLTISGKGVFDPATNIMTISSSTVFGSVSFTSSGTDTIDLNANPKEDNDDVQYATIRMTKSGKKYNDVHYDTMKFSDGTSTGTDFLTFDKVKVPGTDSTAKDIEFLSTGAWDASNEVDSEGIVVLSSGSSPPSGGAGGFIAIVAPVPEPSGCALALVGSCLLGAFIRYWRDRRGEVRRQRG